MSSNPKTILGDLLYQREGQLTRELVRNPGGFGLGQVPARLKPDATTTAVCGFCSTGCGLEVHLKDGQAVNLSPSRDYSVNKGAACPKGWEALTPLRAKDRATTPLLRNARGVLEPVPWQTALEVFCSRFKGIQQRHGAASVAFISTGQIPSEEMALLGSLAKFGMGMLHGDGNTRQCMATSVVAYKQAFGFDAPPYTYQDFEESDVLVFVGANPCIAHPIMWERVCKNPHHPEIVVIDPRKTETAMAATQHLPLRPKSDLRLLYGITNLLIERGYVDREFVAAHVQGFEELAAHVESFGLADVAMDTGLSSESIERLVETIGRGKRVSFWWTMGVNQSHEGVRVAQAIINIALITGNIGRPGTGANSITGQCNAMGSRLFSNTTNLLGGHDFTKPEHRTKVAGVLGIDAESIPRQGSLAYDQILEGVHRGKIKGLWIIATNTAHSWINQSDAQEILKRLDFLVVQDMYSSTETAKLAHLVLPAAGWGEKEGTFINSERRIGMLKKVSRAPGEALADFYIFKLIAEAWGVGEMFRKFESPEATFQLMKGVSRGQPCDITGIRDYAMLDDRRGIQWPLPEGQDVGVQSERRLFEDGQFFHADGKAKLLFEAPRGVPEPTDASFPLILLSGRGTSSQWHTQTRTGKSSVLRKLYPEEVYVEVNPEDARKFQLSPSDHAIVESRRGKLRARVHVTHVVQPGQVFVPMHYAEANQLTFAAFDPYSRQPSYKHCAVRIRKSDRLSE
ncbi:MAG TPA: nitrate reductase [Polyangiaceae bacterium]|nr:nitrate reductase [Polyangiaceae bacterium]